MRGNLPVGDWETGKLDAEKITPIRPGIGRAKQKERASAPIAPMIPPQAATPVCPMCTGAGWLRHDVPVGHPKFGTRGLIKCACKDAEQRARLAAMTYSWLRVDDSALASISFASFDPREQPDFALYTGYLDYAEDYAERMVAGQPCENVMAKGTCGTGKTLLACAVLNALRAQQIPCLYGRAQSLFHALYASRFDQRFIRLASSTPFLIVDEIDKYQSHKQDAPKPEEPRQSNYHKTTLGEIFNARYVAGLPTWLISNEQRDLTPWLDEWTLSRFLGNRRTLEMNGRDCRQRKDAK